MSYFQIIRLLAPEIALTAILFGLLVWDALVLRRESVEMRHETLGRALMAGLLLVLLLYSFQMFDWKNIFVIGHGAFVASRLNTMFKIVVTLLTFVTVVMGLRTPYSRHVGEYYGLVLFSLLGMVFLISSEDLLMIFVALELLSISLYALTAFQKGARRSVEGGLKYFIFGALSSAFLLFGLSYLFAATGRTGLQEMAEALRSQKAAIPIRLLNLGILFTFVGLGFKIAAVPFHLWAPDAYEGAPAPVAALIATGSKVASFVALTKLMLSGLVGAAGNALSWPTHWSTGWTAPVVAVAVLSMLLGNVAAIGQRNVKRLMAYSSIAHAGYILVAMVAVNASGIPASIGVPAIYFYIIIYALTNVGVFGVINAIASQVGGDDFEHFSGAARRAPFLSLLMLIFVLSLAGVPPLAGFFGKFYLFAAAIQADPKDLGLLWLVAFAILMSAVSLYYYLRLAKQMYVLPSANPNRLPSCAATRLTLGLVCLMVVLLGIFPSQMIDTFKSFDDKPDPIWTAPAPPSPPAVEKPESANPS